MFFLHVTSALVLIALVLTVLVQCWSTGGDAPFDEQLPVLGAMTGLVLATVLFTGFFQLGSQNTVPAAVLNKMGATLTGGVLALFGLFYRYRGSASLGVVALTQTAALVCFLLSLYWAVAG